MIAVDGGVARDTGGVGIVEESADIVVKRVLV
jgi:hypothetical protein